MANADEYRGCAALCLKMANTSADSGARAEWLSMALRWRALAKRVTERHADLDLPRLLARARR